MTSTATDHTTATSTDRALITARHLINGEWLGDADTERMNPARPGELAALSPSGTAADVDAAITAAAAAQPGWAALPAPSRGAILMAAGNLLLDRQTAIAEDLVREEGKTLAEAKGEVKRASDVLRFFGSLGWAATGEVLPSGLPDTTITTRREALGVVGLITPWNFPIAIPAWKSAPALISGNAVVIKPAELTPLSATHLARALQDAGLPAGVFNVVHGKGRVVGDALARDPRIAGLSFTGSTAVGLGLQEILNARRARVQLEMGGKNGVLVLDDADPRKAAKVVAAGAFGLTGQACTATSRVYVTPGIRAAFLEALTEEAAAYTPGDGMDAADGGRGQPAAVRAEPGRGALRRRTRRRPAARCVRRRPRRAAALPGRRAHRTAVRRRRRDRGDLRTRWWPCWRSPTTRPAWPRSTIPATASPPASAPTPWRCPRTSRRGRRPASSRSTVRRRAWT